MKKRLLDIVDVISSMQGILIEKPFIDEGISIKGTVKVIMDDLADGLEFDVSIYLAYPLKYHDSETIIFSNKKLLGYGHVMQDGSICIHNAHSHELRKKLQYDFNSLKLWIEKYYINRGIDKHYEHIHVPQNVFKGFLYAFLFTNTKFNFTKHQFGFFEYSYLQDGNYKHDKIKTAIVQNFTDSQSKPLTTINWNSHFKKLPISCGLFLFIEEVPAKFKRFAFENWRELESFIRQDFLEFLHDVEKAYNKKKGSLFPLFIGYRIPGNEIHWEAILLEIGLFPIYGKKFNQKFISVLDDEKTIIWAMTRNCSYEYFFGRGRLNLAITNSKVLIMGIGAIGSIVSTTLARSGCTKIDLIDFDVKEPENVCRSEYSFATGINNKVNDLADSLYSISPFIEVNRKDYIFSERFNSFIKSFHLDDVPKMDIESFLNQYDIIFDCTTDNDLLYVLSCLNIRGSLINLSISNHAKQLVCAVGQNRYDFVRVQFDKILDYDIEDLFNPTGCWSPTFKASYNDINTLVQYAIKHINLRYSHEKPLRNFVIETGTLNEFHINLKEF